MSDKLAQPLGGDWPEYRLLVLSKLDEIQSQQRETAAAILKLSDAQMTAKIDLVREATASATRRSLIAATIPMIISIIVMIFNIYTAKGAQKWEAQANQSAISQSSPAR